MIGGVVLALGLWPANSSAATLNAPQTIYQESFENLAQPLLQPDHAITIDEYVSTAVDFNGQTASMSYDVAGNLSNNDGYSGVPFWRNKQYCNGIWLGAADNYPSGTLPAPYKNFKDANSFDANPANYCRAFNNTVVADAWSNLQVLANVLGQVSNPGTGPLDSQNTGNHVIAAYTQMPGNHNAPGTTFIQFKMNKAVPLPSMPGSQKRFITMSVAMAALNCAKSANNAPTFNPHFDFYLVEDPSKPSMPGIDDSNLTRLTSATIDPCVSGQLYGQVGTAPGQLPKPLSNTNTNNYLTGIYAGQFGSDKPLLVDYSSVALQMVNSNASGQGNDAAFDNLLVQDVTPSLLKSFAAATLNNGGTTRLSFTVSNTTEKMEKSGWSFTDTLPTGMTVAAAPNITDSCGGSTAVNATPGSSTVAISNGLLGAGVESCEVSLDVTVQLPSPLAAASTLQNGLVGNGTPGSVSSVGLNPPTPVSLQVLPVADMSATSAPPQEVDPDVPVTVVTTCTNNGPDTALAATCSVNPADIPADATDVKLSCDPAADLLPGDTLSCTTTFTPHTPERITLTTTAGTSSQDTKPENNTAPSVVTVHPKAPAADMVAQAPTTVTATQDVPTTVTTTCTNAGPDTAVNATCQVSGAPTGATTVCKPATPVSNLAVNAAISCETTFTPTSTDPVTLTTTAASDTTDPVPGNNQAPTTISLDATDPAPAPEPVPVPMDARWMLGLLALALAVMGMRRQRR